MESVFDKAFRLIVGLEGGYVDDPNDPGGETKYGISKRSYPNVDIRNLSLDGAKQIFLHDFWLRCHCPELPEGVAIAVADSAFNQGPEAAISLLQNTVKVLPDGDIGPRTLAAVKAMPETELLGLYMANRAIRYMHTKNFDIYGKGWLKRLFVLVKEC